MATILAVGLVWGSADAAEQEERMPQPSKSVSQVNAQQGPLPLSEEELKKRLTSAQYHVLRENGTEAPFLNAYWNNARPGLYVDVLTGVPLFASTDQFKSGTGWPSFTRPIAPDALKERADAGHGMTRTEVRSTSSDSHLGHVFNDGPEPTGLRYCINSAALRFVPLEELEQVGYGQYRRLFQDAPPKTSH